jgi:hypothetical protein
MQSEETELATPLQSIKEHVSVEEWQLRQDLAALYRLVALHGWDDLIFTQAILK